MRIGIDATPLSVTRTGVGTYTVNLLRALQAMEDDEVVPFLNRPVHPSFHEELSGKELPHHDDTTGTTPRKVTEPSATLALVRRMGLQRPPPCAAALVEQPVKRVGWAPSAASGQA